MILPKITFLTAPAFNLLVSVGAYSIDSSCNPIRRNIEGAVASAMNMATEAKAELSKSPLDPNIADLAGYLFDPGQHKKVIDIMEGIALQQKLKPVGAEDKRIPAIYCDLSRFIDNGQDTIGQDIVWDTKNRLNMRKGVAHIGCQSGGTIAFTKKFSDHDQQQHRDFIQLCPWYLNELGFSHYKALSDMPDGHRLAGAFDSNREPGPGEAWIDVFARLDLTILHEFSHTFLTGRPPPRDYGYGWRECVGLEGNKRCSNAESIAYFGLGTALLKDHGFKVTREGNLLSIKAKEKREPTQHWITKGWKA